MTKLISDNLLFKYVIYYLMSRKSIFNEKPLANAKGRIDGVKVGPEGVDKKVLQLLEVSPRSPKEVADTLNYSREHVSREIFKRLLNRKEIKKIDGSKKYQLSIENHSKASLQNQVLTASEFMKCATIKRWESKHQSMNKYSEIKWILNLCTGRKNKKFKINPDNWAHPDTTIEAIKCLREKYGKQELPWSARQAIRRFLDVGLNAHMSTSEAKQLGITGKRDKAQLAHLELKREGYEKVKKILYSENELEYYKFCFKYWTGARPSSVYLVKVDDLKFYDRITEFVTIDGAKYFESSLLVFLKQLHFISPELKSKVPIQKLTRRACHLRIYEHKTANEFPKYIYDEEFVKKLEKFVAKRKFQKKMYLFWDENKTDFNRENYVDTLHTVVVKDNDFLKDVLFRIGFKPGDFGKKDRANYALRHFSIQHWLQMLKYDYGFVASMFHEDLTITKTVYGEMTKDAHEEKMKGAIFL